MPKGVEIKIDQGLITVKGPKGELKKPLDSHVEIAVEGGQVLVGLKKDSEDFSDRWGLFRALVANMIKGVEVGFEKTLTFQGVGFRAAATGNNLELNLGFSHPVKIEGPAGISFKVEKNKIVVMGIDKEMVGHVAAKVRAKRKPEPYKGSGIRYENEVIIKKAGKKAVATSAG